MKPLEIVQSKFGPHRYARGDFEGRPVIVCSQLGEAHPELAELCVALVTRSLSTLATLVPASAWSKIAHVPIWLEYEDTLLRGGCYHESEAWVNDNEYEPGKAKAIQFTRRIATWIKDQPMMVLHELAHAYHDQVLSYSCPDILDAYHRACAEGKYENVGYLGHFTRKAYALDNHKEFFCELSEAYFGKNDYFPYTRDELRAFDPLSFAVIAAAWEPSRK